MCVEHNVLAKLKRKLMMQRRYFCFRNHIHTYTNTYTANHTIALPTPMHAYTTTRRNSYTDRYAREQVCEYFLGVLRFVEVPLLIVEKV